MAIEVKLNAFEGPLDLLLHLIEKNKVNIYDIPISMITKQYLDYLDEMRKADLDIMSEFLVMAANLLQIKSKMLLPKEKEENEEEEDPREDLVQRLLEYKIYKYASSELRTKGIDAEKHLFKAPTLPEPVLEYRHPIDPGEMIHDQGVTLEQLKVIFEFVMKRRTDKIDPVRSGFGEIRQDEEKVEDKIEAIRDKVMDGRKYSFRELLEEQPTKEALVVTFLALLELMKMGEIEVLQEGVAEEIFLTKREVNEIKQNGDKT